MYGAHSKITVLRLNGMHEEVRGVSDEEVTIMSGSGRQESNMRRYVFQVG